MRRCVEERKNSETKKKIKGAKKLYNSLNYYYTIENRLKKKIVWRLISVPEHIEVRSAKLESKRKRKTKNVVYDK